MKFPNMAGYAHVLYSLVKSFSFAFTGYLIYLMTRTDDKWQSAGYLESRRCDHVHHDYLRGLPSLLAPIATDFLSSREFLCHYIVPLAFLLDTLVLTKPVNTVGLILFLGLVYLCFIWHSLSLMVFLKD